MNPVNNSRWRTTLATVGTLGALLTACASVPERHPIPEELHLQAQIPGIPLARYWGDEVPAFSTEWLNSSDEQLRAANSGVMDCEHHYLAISGGGARGAYGAGLLCGWTAAGNRPEFSVVTGISTGALIAPFAFLGPDYDHIVQEVYTSVSTDDLIETRSKLKTISGDSAAEPSGLRAMIAKSFGEDEMARVAVEYRRGRELLISTTNLDARRPVIWDIGRIASSGDPKSLQLIRDVMLASASIPGAFPPVMIEVEADGQLYDEMHVDGGVTAQVFWYPAELNWKLVMDRLGVVGTPRLYLVRNAFLNPSFETVKRRILPIAGATVSSLIRTQGLGDLYQIYVEMKGEGIDFSMAYIPEDFTMESKSAFDKEYMQALFDLAYARAVNGYPWLKAPPGVDP